jgi:hypothetical protein
MTQQHPITPPPELVREWTQNRGYSCADELWDYLAAQAAQWGADQELEACCKWLPKLPPWSGNDLRKHRRPKPPSLKEQALEAQRRMWSGASNHDDWDLVRRALEQLPD